MSAMAVGAAIGYSSPAVAAFNCQNTTKQNDTDDLCLDEMERGLFNGSLSLGALLGCILAGLLINNLGRKGTMLVSVVPLMLGWLLIGKFLSPLQQPVFSMFRVLRHKRQGKGSLASQNSTNTNLFEELHQKVQTEDQTHLFSSRASPSEWPSFLPPTSPHRIKLDPFSCYCYLKSPEMLLANWTIISNECIQVTTEIQWSSDLCFFI